jgi:nucleoside-diphosphate-sugar epimerase
VLPQTPFSMNVQGTYNVFDAARREDASKVVVLGSAPVHLMPLDGSKVDARSALHATAGSDHLYDLTKRLQEEIARDFCETYSMNISPVRPTRRGDSNNRLSMRSPITRK